MNRRSFLIGSGVMLAGAIGTSHEAFTSTNPHTISSQLKRHKETDILVVGHKHHHKKKTFPSFTKHPKIKIKMSKYDKAVLVKTIWGETRGETDLGKKAVVHVILNRSFSENPLFKNKSISRLCLKKYQFSCWLDKWKMNHIKVDEDYKHIEEVVVNAISEYENGIDYSNGATFYYSDKIDKKPSWVSSVKQVNKIGLHNFYA